MERLTRKSESSSMVWFVDHENGGIELEPCDMDSHHSRLAIAKLAEYEILDEKGLLIKLPCKLGDIVYIVGTKCLADIPLDEECMILNCSTCKYDNEFVVFEKIVDIEFMITLMFKEDTNFIFGETVFTEKTEAEKVLNSK